MSEEMVLKRQELVGQGSGTSKHNNKGGEDKSYQSADTNPMVKLTPIFFWRILIKICLGIAGKNMEKCFLFNANNVGCI